MQRCFAVFTLLCAMRCSNLSYLYIAAGNKRKLNGFIHDESATGKTFYVEPVEVVEINNELRALEYAER